MTDQYAWWREALNLAGPCGELSREQQAALKISEDAPQPGFYRARSVKGGPFRPVAIWFDASGILVCAFDGNSGSDPAKISKIWTWACRYPVTEQIYRDAASGKPWPDEVAPVGHNAASTGDNHEDLTREFADDSETAESLLKSPVMTQEQADQVAAFSKRLAAIGKRADEFHATEKRPVLDEAKRIDERWRDLRDGAASMVKRLKGHIDVFLREQRRLEEERQRKAREEADRARREAEESSRKAAESDQQSEAERAKAIADAERKAEEAAAAERDAMARQTAAGRTGAKVSLRTFVSARIVDYDAALAALKDRQEVREVIQFLANRAVKSGFDLPGIERVEEQRAV